MNPELPMYWDSVAGLLAYMPAVHLALGLLALTSVTLAAGLLSMTFFRSNSRWRSLAMRFTVAATVLVVAGDLLAQLSWNSSDDGTSGPSVAIRISAPYAQTLAAVLHPGERVISADELSSFNHPLTQDQVTSPPAANRLGQMVTQSHHRLIPWPERVEGVFDCFWAAACLIMALRQIFGQIGVSRVSGASESITNPEALEAFGELAAQFDLPQRGWRAVRLRASRSIDAPFVSGFLVYTIYVPVRALPESGGSGDDFMAMLAHELAHARHRDPLMALLAQALCAACWFQPLAWLAARQLEASAELAADADTMVVTGCRPSEYANLLHSIAAGRIRLLTEAVAGVGMMPRRSQLAGRIEQIVRGGVSAFSVRVSRAQRIGLAIVCGLLVAMGVAACIVRYSPSDAEAAAHGKIILTPAWAVTNAELAGYTLARQNGWSVGAAQTPIAGTIPDNGSGGFGQTISARERSDVAALNKLQFVLMTGSGWRPSSAEKAAVEGVLAQSPRFFYAEELLSAWYLKDGQSDPAQQWHARALQDAPQILAGQVERETGGPTGDGASRLVPVAGFQFECCTRTTTQWNQRPYPEGVQCNYTIVTDASGNYYLPTFAGINDLATQSFWSYPAHTTADHLLVNYSLQQAGGTPLSGIVFSTRVGVVARQVLRPYIPLTLGGKLVTSSDNGLGSSLHPFSLKGNTAVAAWGQRNDANQYSIIVFERRYFGQKGAYEEMPIIQAAVGAGTLREYSLPLAGGPGFVSGRVYSVQISAMHTVAMPGTMNSYEVAGSVPVYFTLPSQPAKLPLTPNALSSCLKGGVTNLRIVARKSGATITFQADSFLDGDYDRFFQRGLFGYSSDNVSSRQIALPVAAPGVPYNPGRSTYTIRLSNAPRSLIVSAPPGLT